MSREEGRVIMDRSTAWVLWAAGSLGACGVLLGAFAAHGLEDWLLGRGLDADRVAARVAQANTGVRYHLVHAVALLGLYGAIPRLRVGMAVWVARLMVAGVFLFSGSLYLLVALDQPKLGAITPLGGLSWIVAWGLLVFAASRE